MVGGFSPFNAVVIAAQVRVSSIRDILRRQATNVMGQMLERQHHLLWSLSCVQLWWSRPREGHLWSGPVISGTGTLAVDHSGLVGFGRGGSAQAMVALHTMNARLEWDLGSCLGHFVMWLNPSLNGICDVLPWAGVSDSWPCVITTYSFAEWAFLFYLVETLLGSAMWLLYALWVFLPFINSFSMLFYRNIKGF